MVTTMPACRARIGWTCTLALISGVLAAAAPVHATTTVTLEPPAATVLPDTTFTFLVRIDGVQALAGYTLDLRVVPQAGAIGTVTGNAAVTNFYPIENLIEIDGNGLMPLGSGSEIVQTAAGLRVTGIDQTFTATAVPGPGHDVLAEVAFDTSADAMGDFDFMLGDETVLVVDGSTAEVFEPVLLTIHVPEPGSLCLLGGAGLLLVLGQRRRAAA